MPVKSGSIQQFGHPYIEIVVSADGLMGEKFPALVDTGYSGFVSLPAADAVRLGLDAHTTAQFLLADGSLSATPIADGFACFEGDPFVHGLISLTQHAAAAVGVNFLQRCGKSMVLLSDRVLFIDENDSSMRMICSMR